MIEQVADAMAKLFLQLRPSVFGAFREFGLTERGIDWAVGVRSGSIPFDRVRRSRMSVSAVQHAAAPFRDERGPTGLRSC